MILTTERKRLLDLAVMCLKHAAASTHNTWLTPVAVRLIGLADRAGQPDHAEATKAQAGLFDEIEKLLRDTTARRVRELMHVAVCDLERNMRAAPMGVRK